MKKALCCLSILLLGWCSAVGAAPEGRLAPARGVVLVAAEGMRDPRFAASVVLLIDVQPQGVAGLILNRPGRITLGQAFATHPELSGNKHPLFYGGPVSPDTVTGLLRDDRSPGASDRIVPGLQLVKITELPPALLRAAGPERLRIFSGYAGWLPRQLAGEIARGDWYLVPAEAALLFTTPPERLWEELRRRGNEVWL